MMYMVSTTPHKAQRYDTCGDWIAERNQLRYIRVSELGNEDYAFLVGIHEQIEAWLCLKRGITQRAVDAFDMEFESRREPGDESEPGWEPHAPYHREHVFAEKVERMLADELGVDWDEYDRTVMGL